MGSETKAPDKTSELRCSYYSDEWAPRWNDDPRNEKWCECPNCRVSFTQAWPPIEGEVPPPAASALDVQISGDHYKNRKIQPVEFIHANNLPFIEGCVVKYVTRWREKGGVPDLLKAKHYIELLIELEGRKAADAVR